MWLKVLLAIDGGDVPGGWAAFGSTLTLLGPVLYWLCYVHLPAKDKQIKELIEQKDAQISALIAKHDATEKEQRLDFRQALDATIRGAAAQSQALAEAAKRDLDSFAAMMRANMENMVRTIVEHKS